MNPKKEKYWKTCGGAFDQFYHHPSFLSAKQVVARFLEYRTHLLIKHLRLKPGGSLLDLGCGSGIQMKLLASQCKNIVGVDVSPDLLALAKKNLETIPTKNWSLVECSAENMPFPPHSFDAVIALGLLDYVENPLEVMRECVRVLQHGGTIIFTIPKKPSPFALLRQGIGARLRKLIFDLPPIANALNVHELHDLTQSLGLRITMLKSLWGASWLVQSEKPVFSTRQLKTPPTAD